jgi:hypothetical protein
MPYADGTFTAFKQSGPTRVSYPFLNYPTKDKVTKRYDITGWVLPGSYTPANALSTYPGDGTIAADNVAYLVNESEPQLVAGSYSVDRAYCNIPNTQTRWGSQIIVRPVMHDIATAGVYAVTLDEGETSHLFNSRLTCVQVYDQNTTTQLRLLENTSSNGASDGDTLIAWNGDRIVGITTIFEVNSASSVTVQANEAPWNANSLAITHFQVARSAWKRVVNNEINVSTKITENFYLPSVTPGISTPSDITLYPSELDPVSWLAAIAASNTWAVVNGTEVDVWQGPIYRATKTEVRLADAVRTVAVGT